MARSDPYLDFRFKILIAGIIEGGCNELSGLQATTQTEDYIEGGVNTFVHKLPKETTFENLILKRGLGDSYVLWLWHRGVILNRFPRLDVTIMLLKEDLESVGYLWSFRQAYPVKWTGPTFKADSNAVAFETLELTHHGYTETSLI